jgi:hypothetical protein
MWETYIRSTTLNKWAPALPETSICVCVCVCHASVRSKSHDAGLLLPDTAGGVSHTCTWIHNLQFVALGMGPFILPCTASNLEAQTFLPKAV